MNKPPLPPGFQSRQIQPLDLPNPASFRELRPAILGTPSVPPKTRLFERKRLMIGLAIAAAFHVTLGLAWWLTPPLRLKAGIDPKRWVQVVSVPEDVVPAAPPEVPSVRPPPASRPPHQHPSTAPTQLLAPNPDAKL